MARALEEVEVEKKKSSARKIRRRDDGEVPATSSVVLVLVCPFFRAGSAIACGASKGSAEPCSDATKDRVALCARRVPNSVS